MNKKKFAIFSTLLVSSIITGGCAIHLVSDYDADMDKGVTDVQTSVNQIVAKMRDCALKDTRSHIGNNPLPKDPAQIICQDTSTTYSADDYNKIQNQLDTLIVRSQSNPHNQPTTNSLINLEGAILQYPSQVLNTSNTTASATGTPPENAKKPEMSIQERQQLKNAPISVADLNDLTMTSGILIQSILTFELAKKTGDSSSSK
ncbi:hypothetical protein [Paraburkholderia sp. J8-2]|uniref:hypothetical protein n=1 Tax=Paraburkholderia sp. J8-2 TaxID=2805440 RepID=UPI002AB76365|nr:hypothetical protein [Paraburkholderia sp. J8-2]